MVLKWFLVIYVWFSDLLSFAVNDVTLIYNCDESEVSCGSRATGSDLVPSTIRIGIKQTRVPAASEPHEKTVLLF